MYVCILQQDNTQNIKPEGQQGSEALTGARSKKCLEQILATTHNMISQYISQNISQARGTQGRFENYYWRLSCSSMVI